VDLIQNEKTPGGQLSIAQHRDIAPASCKPVRDKNEMSFGISSEMLAVCPEQLTPTTRPCRFSRSLTKKDFQPMAVRWDYPHLNDDNDLRPLMSTSAGIHAYQDCEHEICENGARHYTPLLLPCDLKYVAVSDVLHVLV
jgi:hypothetical protein